MMASLDNADFPQLKDVREYLREESENRVVQTEELPLFECVASTIRYMLPNNDNGSAATSNNIDYYKKSENIKTRVVDLLKKKYKQLKPVLNMLLENVHMQDSHTKDYKKQLYEMILKDCNSGSNYQIYVKLFLYAAATCINTPLYVLHMNEIGDLQWVYYQPLFRYEDQPVCVIKYVTMYMSSMKTFFRIKQNDSSAPAPKATGLVGMYLKMLKATEICDIDVPECLLDLPSASQSQICNGCDRDIVRQCCNLFRELRLIQIEEFEDMTAHRASMKRFKNVCENSPAAFKVLCQVLISRREKTILAPYVSRWESFVSSCDYWRKFEALVTLDNTVYNRNVTVTVFVQSCLSGGREIDDRRKKVTTTVISSSSLGIVSGGLIIAGLVLAPVSFGSSLALSIAGGTVGVGAGLTAGTARAVEAVKQKKTMTSIKTQQARMREKERAVSDALRDIERAFQTFVGNAQDAENGEFVSSLHGLLAVGSTLRATHGGFGIALTATRLTASAASISAAVLGPLSLF